MLYSIRGRLVYWDSQSVAVECAGVAYHCQTSFSTLQKLGRQEKEVMLYTFLYVRSEAVDLYGFADREELACFKMLISVSGVGAKVALGILSSMTPERVALCVASGDYKSLTAAPGVGNKLAQRIVLELRDKVKNADVAKGISSGLPAGAQLDTGNAAEAISALVVLGYAQADAATVVAALDSSASVEDMIKTGLKALARSAGR